MQQNTFTSFLRYALFLLGAVGLGLTVGFLLQAEWAKMFIPWELNRMACIFLASIFCAASVPMLWIAVTREYAALAGGAINFSVLLAGFAAFALQAFSNNPRQAVLLFGMYCAAALLVSLALFAFALRQPFRDTRPTPRLVRYSFVLFAVVLFLSGSALAFQVPNIFPWQLTPQQSVLYGWIFLGNSMYFVYGILRPVWGNAQGQLLGFLAYDLILIIPLLLLPVSGEPYLLFNLVVYIAVLLYSGALAVYYLFIRRETRVALAPVNMTAPAR